jgi:hypothetical protein
MGHQQSGQGMFGLHMLQQRQTNAATRQISEHVCNFDVHSPFEEPMYNTTWSKQTILNWPIARR